MAEVTELPRKSTERAALRFEIGQTVYLRSGSPPLNVYSGQPGSKGFGERTTCDWFVDGVENRAEFMAAQLVESDPAK